MRNLIKSGNYSFTADSRQITVAGDSFTVEDIRLIVNETQKVIITSSMQKDMITSVANGVITYSNTLPVLAAGDKLTIEIDYPLPTGLNILNEYDSYRTKVASAVTIQKQNATPADTADQMHAKILAITGNVTVIPIQGNEQWHDLAYEIAQWNDIENPYVCAVLLNPGISQVFLTGASKYKVSDGKVYTSSQTVTIGANESGRESKVTKYIIFRASTPYISISFGSYPNIALSKNILMFYNKNCDYSTLSFASAYVPYFVNDAELKNPIVFGADRKLLNFTTDQFKGNSTDRFIFPPFASDASNAEKTLTLSPSMFSGTIGLCDIIYPDGLLSLTVGNNCFSSCTGLISMVFPNSITSLTFGTQSFSYSSITNIKYPSGIKSLFIGSDCFTGSSMTKYVMPSGLDSLTITANAFVNSASTYIYISKPTTSLSVSQLNLTSTQNVELESNFNFTISLVGLTGLTAANTYTGICQRLVDYRAVPAQGTPTLQTSTANAKCYGTNTQFTKVHHVGETIYVNAVAKVIQSIESDTELTMTTNGSSTASGLSYGSGKTLTLAAAVKTALTSSYPTWQTDLQAKGWTIA